MSSTNLAGSALAYIEKGEPLTTSVIVAENLNARHGDFIRLVDRYLIKKGFSDYHE